MKLPASLDPNSIAELYLELEAALQSGEAAVLEGSAVTQASAPALQLLAVFAQECRRRGSPPLWESPSPPLVQAVELLALTQLIGIEEA